MPVLVTWIMTRKGQTNLQFPRYPVKVPNLGHPVRSENIKKIKKSNRHQKKLWKRRDRFREHCAIFLSATLKYSLLCYYLKRVLFNSLVRWNRQENWSRDVRKSRRNNYIRIHCYLNCAFEAKESCILPSGIKNLATNFVRIYWMSIFPAHDTF